MVVLDGHNMMGTGPNQYLQPDYMSPLQTTLDSKKSPLALLAQTCSQIGSDTISTKSLIPSLSDSSKRKSSTCSSTEQESKEGSSISRPRSSSGTPKNTNSILSNGKASPAFKPYEKEPQQRKSPLSHSPNSEKSTSSCKSPNKRPASASPENVQVGPTAKQSRKSPNEKIGDKNKSCSSSSTSSDSVEHNNNTGKSSPKNEHGASPIIRSGLEVLHGQMNKDSFPKLNSSALSSLSALAAHYPPGFDPSSPALRAPFFPPPSAPHHFLGSPYPPMGSAPNSPYVSYTRVKTPGGAETIVPVCKDPYCTGCSLSMPGLMANAAAMAAAAGFPGFLNPVCPAGCLQCDHQKFMSPFMPPPGLGLGSPPTSTGSYPSSLLSSHAAAAAAAQQRPYICNWIVGESYCGKRFPSSEELLQHLRTHTNSSESSSSISSSPSSIYSNALLSSSMSAAAAAAAAVMHRNYPTPPLSPLSAARYNPYSAGGGVSLGSKPGSGFGVPTSLSSLMPHPQSLANYYSAMSPYAMYGQRIGPPVHQ